MPPRTRERRREIDVGLAGAEYEATDEESAGIDRGLRDAEQVETVLAKLRGA